MLRCCSTGLGIIVLFHMMPILNLLTLMSGRSNVGSVWLLSPPVKLLLKKQTVVVLLMDFSYIIILVVQLSGSLRMQLLDCRGQRLFLWIRGITLLSRQMVLHCVCLSMEILRILPLQIRLRIMLEISLLDIRHLIRHCISMAGSTNSASPRA